MSNEQNQAPAQGDTRAVVGAGKDPRLGGSTYGPMDLRRVELLNERETLYEEQHESDLIITEQAEQNFVLMSQRDMAFVRVRELELELELEAARLPPVPSAAHPPSPPRTPSPSPPPTPSVTPGLVPAAVGPTPGFGKGGAPWSRGNGVKRYIRRRKPRNQNPNPAKRMRVLDYFSADNLKPAPAPRTRRPPKPYPQ